MAPEARGRVNYDGVRDTSEVVRVKRSWSRSRAWDLVGASRLVIRACSLVRPRRSRCFESLYGTCEGKPADKRARDRVIPCRVFVFVEKIERKTERASPATRPRSSKRERGGGEKERESRFREYACSCARGSVEVTSCEIYGFSREKLTRFRGTD